MKHTEILEAFETRKGANIRVRWMRQLETYKGITAHVTKRTEAYVCAGKDFSNLGSVKAGIAEGARDEVQPLPETQEWEVFPFIIRDKDTGDRLARFYPATLPNLAAQKRTEYFIDGTPATEAQVRELCTAKNFRKSDRPLVCFNVKCEDVEWIG